MNTVKFKPLADYVLISPVTEEDKKSVIVVPVEEKPSKGVVVAVGDGKLGVPMTVKSEDAVAFNPHSGTKLKLEGVEFLIMQESEIYGII